MIECAPASEITMTYNEAVLYCMFCNYNGHRDWRLPTTDEYKSIKTPPVHWFVNRKSSFSTWGVLPVRDVDICWGVLPVRSID